MLSPGSRSRPSTRMVRNRQSRTPALLRSLSEETMRITSSNHPCSAGPDCPAVPAKGAHLEHLRDQRNPFPRTARLEGFGSSMSSPQLDQLCSQWLSNHRFELNPQLPIVFNPSALHILLLFYTVQSLINSFLTNVFLQQMHIL